MDGSDRKSNSFSSTSNKHRSSINKGIDENGKSYQPNDKQTKTKHYMSPTISAASKFSHSKREILAERNESVDNIPNLDSKIVGKAASFGSNRESNSESIKSEENSRPRLGEILLGSGTGEKEGENNAVMANLVLDSVGRMGQQPQLGGGIDESDDEFEEVDDEGGWGLKGALKLLILLLVLVLSTSYVDTMNSATPSPVVKAVFGLRNGYQIMEDHVNQKLGVFGAVEEHKGVAESTNEMTEVVVEDEAGEGEVDKVVAGKRGEEEKDEEITEEEEEEGEVDGREISDFSNSEMLETVVQESMKDDMFEEERDKGFIKSALSWLSVIASVILGLKLFRKGKENNNTLVPTSAVAESPIPDEEETPIESAANFLISKSMMHKEQDLNWTLSHESRAAPTIELLGELDVTEMSSSSLRMIKNSSRVVIESEVSSHSVPKMDKTTTICSTPPDVQTPASLHISTLHYPSLSNDKNSIKKKASEGVDDNAITTPLRRSSRLRNRVTSP